MNRHPVTVSMRGSVAVVTVDDGEANTLDANLIYPLLSALKTAQEQAGAVVLAGRPGFYSAGLDMETLRRGAEAASDLLHGGTELILRLLEFPRPVVAACTGHALGAAAVSLLCCDVRIGTAGDFRIGMDWVSLGLPVPDLAVELARCRLSPRHMTLACNTAQIYSPDEAAEAGFLDSVTTGDAVEQACEAAADLFQRLDPKAFEITRRITCRALTDAIMRAAGDLFQVSRAVPRATENRDGLVAGSGPQN